MGNRGGSQAWRDDEITGEILGGRELGPGLLDVAPVSKNGFFVPAGCGPVPNLLDSREAVAETGAGQFPNYGRHSCQDARYELAQRARPCCV